ncbi:hypothetical protein [Mucilaginibacter boryungensis]|uniref:Uncharacterized protein n=1 Tax=Mucilaginibacter boryungensis TaxID=768480 RepID=A0ABR9XL75_9SPHI|nr:hypothetical protein [Mucilaginibacter boryungensis]MBE9668118.1 hypothetical protein [Mucilaginibacter boryungensis]
MRNRPICLLFIVALWLCQPHCVHAQEENTLIVQGSRYIDFKVKSLNKLNVRLERQQKRLLKRLTRREQRFAAKLKQKDSAAYDRYSHQLLSYDSIQKLSQPDSAMLAKTATRHNASIDSLKAIRSFIQNKSSALNTNTQLPTTDPKLSQLQSQLNYRSYINDLIYQRTNTLQSIAGSNNMPAFTGIQKQVYYAKQKMNVFKEMEEEPTKAEDQAMEYLQGTDGFDKYMDKATAGPNSMQNLGPNATAADLQKMGLQTKQQVQAALQQRFGSNLSGLSPKMGDQIKSFQDKTQNINTAKQSLQSLRHLKHINRPSFKINPMRGLPFWKRIEKQYNFQTTRATIDGAPAILQLSAMAGYRQSPKLSYGIGVVEATGLGQSWTDLRLSFQGVGLRSYTAWQWQYGIGIYAGYERLYKQAAFSNTTSTDQTSAPSLHSTNTYNESILIGLTKNYHINDKWNGTIQVLYDIWWQQKGLSSPIVLRFSTISK